MALKRVKSKNTQEASYYLITRLIRHFGKLLISDISEVTWAEFISQEWTRGKRKFYDDRKYMRMILLYALREGMIQKDVKLSIPDLPRDAGREIVAPERARLFLFASPNLRFQIEIAWKMGLRLREMMHLRWDQFDWEKLTIRLLASDTKTRRPREIPINPDLISEFQNRHLRHNSPFVFPSPKNLLVPQDNNKTAWRKCKKKAGIFARWHDLRHTCASEMLRRGIPLHVVKRYLGMTERVLIRIYAHLSLDDLKNAANVMRDLPTNDS